MDRNRSWGWSGSRSTGNNSRECLAVRRLIETVVDRGGSRDYEVEARHSLEP